MSVARWLAAVHRPACLDVRGASDFAAGHLPGAGNVPAAELAARIHELPRRGEMLFIVGGGLARSAAAMLAARGRWSIQWSEEAPSQWPGAEMVAGAPAPLWSPNLWLREHFHAIPAGGRVFDLAMGSGRNAVFLALNGYRVSGEDILPEAVEFAEQLAARHDVELAARVGDLGRKGALPVKAFDGVVVFNYLDRALLPAIAEALAPGGVLIYETFTAEQGRRVGRPKNPQWLLNPMELHDAFAARLQMLAYREGCSAPDRHVASLVARRES